MAPTGCTQYFFGATSNSVQSYNYNSGNGQHLANQDQQICVRRERGSCRICWYAAIVTDFAISGTTANAAGYNVHTYCCGYTAAIAMIVRGNDCVHIPGAQKFTTPFTRTRSNFCGRNLGLVTSAMTGTGQPATASKSICCET